MSSKISQKRTWAQLLKAFLGTEEGGHPWGAQLGNKGARVSVGGSTQKDINSQVPPNPFQAQIKRVLAAGNESHWTMMHTKMKGFQGDVGSTDSICCATISPISASGD